MKRLSAALFFGLFLAIGAGASTVSFIVIETGLPQGEKNRNSLRWENNLMDVFFDSGFIVSNAPILRFETKPARDRMQDFIMADLDEAREGGADYFVAAQLDYTADFARPQEVTFIMYRISPASKIHESRIAWKDYKSETDESDDLKKIIRGLIHYLR